MAKVGKYELVKKLATGGMAEVFLAKFEWARGLERTVVVKRILYHLAEDPSFIEMFFNEAQLAAQLSHPNIAQIIEFGESEGVYFLAMEYIDGPSLRSLAAAAHADGTGIPFPHCARIAAFCCEALAHAHELTDAATGQPLNIVHRDVSPDNILISKTGSVKLVDFGIAKAATQNHQTKTGLVKGKLAYMAPEQIRAEPLDRRADVFALGVVLYEMVAGKKPYEAPSEITLIHAMLYEDRVPLRSRRKDAPPELERIIDKALERDRDKRYADCRAMHADLEEYLISVRQPVSALQIAQLVEKYRPPPGKAEGTPPKAMATPDRPVALAKTPEPWRAERTPAGDATAQIRKPLQRTGTDGDLEKTAMTEREMPAVVPPPPIEKKESAPPQVPPEPPPPPPSTAHPAPQAVKSPAPAARSRAPIIAAMVAAVVLLVVAAAFLWPSKEPQPEKPQAAVQEKQEDREKKQAPEKEPEAEKDAGAEAIAAMPQTPPKTERRPPQTPSHEDRRPPPTIKLVLKSEPPGMLKVFRGGKLRGSGQGSLTVDLPPGPVEVEASGSGQQPFSKRETITLEPASKRHEHTIVVKQGIIMARSVPASHVFLDGVLRGDTPHRIPAYEGQHTMRFECDRSIPQCANAADVTKPVTVEAEKTVEISHRWQ